MEIGYTPEEISAFVKGEMAPSERRDFLQKMKDNPALAAAVAEAQFALDLADELLRRELREKMKAWDAEKKTPPPPAPPLAEPAPAPSASLRWWAAIVAAALLAAMVFWVKNREPQEQPNPQEAIVSTDTASVAQPPKDTAQTTGNDKPTTQPTQKLPSDKAPISRPQAPPQASAEPEPYELSSEQVATLDTFLHIERRGSESRRTRSQPTKNLSLLKQGNALIAQRRYEDAIAQLQEIPLSDTDKYWTAQMYIGDALFFQKKYREAEQAYLAVQRQGSDFRDKLRWRLAVIYSAQGQKDRLKAHLQDILNDPTHPDHDRANRLLKAIR